jgi:hypothetical protein
VGPRRIQSNQYLLDSLVGLIPSPTLSPTSEIKRFVSEFEPRRLITVGIIIVLFTTGKSKSITSCNNDQVGYHKTELRTRKNEYGVKT